MQNIAVFGAGRIGAIHAANLAVLSGVKLHCICDALPQAAAALAQKLDVPVATADSVFDDSRVDAIAICSPTNTHSDLITRAAQTGKHVFCEKPVDLSVSRAQAVADTVAQAGIGCMIGFQRRFDPSFSQAWQRLQAGAVGNPEMLVITSRDPGAPPVEYIQASGGIFRDMLIHDLDMFRWLLCADGDEAAWLSATASVLTDTAIAALGDYDSTAVTIRTRKGRLCQINTSRCAVYGYDQRFELLGADGMLQCGNPAPNPLVQWDAQGVHTDTPEHFFLQRYAQAYRLEMIHFLECLQSGQAFKTTVHDGVLAQRLADAATQSASTGQAVVF